MGDRYLLVGDDEDDYDPDTGLTSDSSDYGGVVDGEGFTINVISDGVLVSLSTDVVSTSGKGETLSEADVSDLLATTLLNDTTLRATIHTTRTEAIGSSLNGSTFNTTHPSSSVTNATHTPISPSMSIITNVEKMGSGVAPLYSDSLASAQTETTANIIVAKTCSNGVVINAELDTSTTVNGSLGELVADTILHESSAETLTEVLLTLSETETIGKSSAQTLSEGLLSEFSSDTTDTSDVAKAIPDTEIPTVISECLETIEDTATRSEAISTAVEVVDQSGEFDTTVEIAAIASTVVSNHLDGQPDTVSKTEGDIVNLLSEDVGSSHSYSTSSSKETPFSTSTIGGEGMSHALSDVVHTIADSSIILKSSTSFSVPSTDIPLTESKTLNTINSTSTFADGLLTNVDVESLVSTLLVEALFFGSASGNNSVEVLTDSSSVQLLSEETIAEVLTNQIIRVLNDENDVEVTK